MDRLQALKQGLSMFMPQPKIKHEQAPPPPHEVTPPPNASLAPYTGVWTTNEVIHLLKRTMFGAKKADVDYFLTKTMDQSVDELLTVPAAPPAPPLKYNSANASALVATNVYVTTPVGSTWTTKPDPANPGSYIPAYDSSTGSEQYTSLQGWWVKLMIEQNRSIVEKMVMFLHNLNPVEWGSLEYAYLGYRYSALLRSYALGNYKAYIKDLTKDGFMMYYLGNYTNYSTAPNENYARELQELFTIGLIADDPGAYTNTDVATAAKVLTGHTFDYNTGLYSFNSSKHSTATKTFSSFYNGQAITSNGAAELDTMLTMIFNKTETAQHIVTKLYRYFVYYKIDPTIQTDVINPLATLLQANNYDLLPVLSMLFRSQHFYDVASQGCIIKSPLDLFIGAIREFNVTIPSAATNLQEHYQTMYWISSNFLAVTGQQPLYPPDVAGWKAYRQEPNFHELWINTNNIQNRDKYLANFINGLTLYTFPFKVDVVAFAQTMSAPSDPDQLVLDFCTYLFRAPVAQSVRDALKTANLLGGQPTNSYWTSAWNTYWATPTPANLTIITGRLKTLLLQLFKMAEYQLM